MDRSYRNSPLVQYALWGTLSLSSLLAVRFWYGYPVFHSVAELFAITVAISTFMLAWNARRVIDNGYVLFLGIALLFIGIVDALHTLSYQGVEIFNGYSAYELPTQLWLVGRYLQASAVVIAPWFVYRRPRPGRTLTVYAIVTFVLVALIFSGHFPSALPGPGQLTPFKIWSEWIVIAAFLVGYVELRARRRAFDDIVYRLLSASLLVSVAAELAFMLYGTPQATANLAGHLLRIVAYFLLYRAIIVTGVARPYELLFHRLTEQTEELAESELRFRSTFEQATVGIAHISIDGEWLLANRRMHEITGYSTDELRKISPTQITLSDDRQAEEMLRERLVSGELTEYHLEERWVQASGAVIWVNVASSVVRSAAGTPRYFVLIVEDISPRKLAEQRMQQVRELSEALGAINRAINSTFDRNEVMRRVTSLGTAVIRADSAAVWIREHEAWTPSLAHGYPDDIVGLKFTDEQVPHLAESIKLESPIAASDLTLTLPAGMFGSEDAPAVGSLLAIPLQFRGEQYGALTFFWNKDQHEFTRAELDFANKLGAALALAMDNARLYAIERRTADTVQEIMLRTDKDLPGLDVAWAYRSATELRQIGGDFFDVFALDGDRYGFVIGDVAGKGIEAAGLTTIAKSTLRAFAYEYDDPVRVVSAVNRSLAQQVTEGRFITVVYGVLDTTTGTIKLVCCGHPLPLVCDELGCTEQAAATNPPLGVLPDLTFEGFDVHLTPGHRIVLFSDGLLDARSGSDFFGEERVRRCIDSLADADPRVVVDTLMYEAEKHAGGMPTDDIAILAMRFLGEPQGDETDGGKQEVLP